MCPLCKGKQTEGYHSDQFRDYLICRDCSLVFVPEPFHLSTKDEKGRYDQHKNDPNDAGYREFLSRFLDPLLKRIPEDACGLDFGCGPGPTLSVMLEAAGHQVDLFDKFYAPDHGVFHKAYDFVTATEVVEHLSHPWFELDRLYGMIKKGGILGIMTKLVIGPDAFANWHYKRDLTHIAFFSRATFEWLVTTWDSRVEFIGNDVIMIHKAS